MKKTDCNVTRDVGSMYRMSIDDRDGTERALDIHVSSISIVEGQWAYNQHLRKVPARKGEPPYVASCIIRANGGENRQTDM